MKSSEATMIGSIPVENGDVLTAVRNFLRNLLESGLVKALYLPLEAGDDAIIPALVIDPGRVNLANPLAPVMPINGARAVAALTGKHSPVRLGVVLRQCEIRALIELVKLRQASLENVVVIGLDCVGTYEVNDYRDMQRLGSFDLTEYKQAAKEGRDPAVEGFHLRPACQMCTQPIPEQADIHLQFVGADLNHEIPVALKDGIAAELDLPASSTPPDDAREAILQRMLNARHQVRAQELRTIQDRMLADGGLASIFATCIRCHNCMTVCPMCYCKTCLFKTAAFDFEPEAYLANARRKGALRMLSDSLLFHLTRMNHMSASCVSCGMCTSACPVEIPVGMIFSVVGSQVQSSFNYQPGRDVNDPLPLITFQTDEWMEVGEE